MSVSRNPRIRSAERTLYPLSFTHILLQSMQPTACLSRYDYQRLHARQSHRLAELCHPGGILHLRRFGHGLICRTNGAFRED